MPNCKKCNTLFPNRLFVSGKLRNFSTRSFCIDCSPFGSHNTRDLNLEKPEKQKTYRHVKKFRRKKKQQCIDYLGGKCSVCGYNKCPGALHMHHIDPDQKDFAITEKAAWGFERIKEELEKCILLCANCHAEHHYTW